MIIKDFKSAKQRCSNLLVKDKLKFIYLKNLIEYEITKTIDNTI